jgi:predicted amidohydrolase
MRIGFVQFTPEFGAVERNREALCALVAEADADLLVLPELALSGYQLRDRAEALELSEPADGPTARALGAECRRGRGRHLVVGFAERGAGPDGARVWNAALVVGPGGALGTYRKTHLFGAEPDWSEPGDSGFRVWDLGGCRLGVMVCFDWAFPEAARSLALLGADVIAHPSNLVLAHCQRAMPVRALENRVFTVTANRCGAEDRTGAALRFTGRSVIAGPDGAVLAEGAGDHDDRAVVEIDPQRARDKWMTPRNHVLANRRPELYR